MPFVRRQSLGRFATLPALAALAFLIAWLAACGPAAPPKAATDLAVGGEKGASSQPIAAAAPSEGAAEDDTAVPIASDDPVRGSRLAYVTVVVFSDFQCPFCGRLASTLEAVRDAYGDDVRLVFKHVPLSFHEHARLAAEVGSAVYALKGSEAFWRYHDMAFRRQQLIGPDSIRAWAMAAGVDSRELEDGLGKKLWSAKVARDEAVASRIGVNGTPASFVNGVSLSGAQPLESFKEVIDAELAKAKALAGSGVARDRIYARMTAANFRMEKPSRDDDDDAPKADTGVWKVPVGSSPVRGPSAALVTIVEFGEFQCPFCRKVQPTLERLRNEYGDRLRFVWKDEPLSFHNRAMPAAQLARAARAQKGDLAFWAAHDKLFAGSALEDSDLEGAARAAGVDTKKAMAAVAAKTHAKGIEDDLLLADDVAASGTPHFFINGRRLVGAQPYEKFKEIVEAELTKAEALVRGGVAKTAVYEAIIKDGSTAPEPEKKAVALSASPAPFRGAAGAKVVIQEFSDFQCPFCSRVEPTLDELLKAYPGKVKIVWRNNPLPFHADAPLAAEASREAFAQKGNDGFSKMRELLFKHQGDPDGLKRTALEGYAAQVGLDLKRFGKALDDGTHKASIEADKQAAAGAGMGGTPAFIIGQYALSGAQPLLKFKKLVDRVLREPVAPPLPPVAVNALAPALGGGTTLPGGLVVNDLKVGSGAPVKSGDKVSVHYVGTLKDGTEFDASRKHGGSPFSFQVGAGQVIKGWDQGLVGMKAGGRRRLTIPSDLGYGDRGSPPVIPPKSTLVFDIELLSIP